MGKYIVIVDARELNIGVVILSNDDGTSMIFYSLEAVHEVTNKHSLCKACGYWIFDIEEGEGV